MGITATRENRVNIDQAIHQIVGTAYKDCPATWRDLKSWLNDDAKRGELVERLRQTVRNIA